MFDLAYTLESYDLVPATEGIVSKIGRGIKAVFDFIVKKIKGAIAFLTGKKKEIVKLSENKDRIPENYKINREKASRNAQYRTDMRVSIPKIWSSINTLELALAMLIDDTESLVKKEGKQTDEDGFSRDRDRMLPKIERIDLEIDSAILPSLDRLNRAKNPIGLVIWETDLNKAISQLSNICAKWENLQKNCENIEISNELTQMISKIAQANARCVDIIVKVTNTLSRVKFVEYEDPAWQMKLIKRSR